MKKVIFKYGIPPLNGAVFLPQEAIIISVQVDEKDGNPSLWAIVDYPPTPATRPIKLLCTGDSFDEAELDGLKYAGTFQSMGFVGHVFA